MTKTKDELKEMFSTGKKPTGDDFAQLIEGVEGPQGPKGDKGTAGNKGDKGDKGDKGADGFGTEAQYNDIIARLEALENPEG
ncbi:hypothetical protein [Sporosarcina sp. FSL W7-1283]|uniref:hypothetical protein n=1 Tax=Sporosarcina sp. FSL W7-1283 TaxID=2921560 RepID=UPI0030F74E85